MICEIISIGTELLLGDITDTNARYLSEKMKEMGFSVYFRQTCGDNRERIQSTLSLALSRADLVIATGGLGPTYDDITREVAAELFLAPLEESEEVKKLKESKNVSKSLILKALTLREKFNFPPPR